MKEKIDFLKGLQEQMRYEDKYDNDIQASPRFWVIGDYRWKVSLEGNAERHSVHIPAHGASYEINSFIEEEKNNEDPSVSDDWVASIDNITCEFSALEWIREYVDHNAYIIPEEEEHFIREDTLFLTKKEAKGHIEMNKHHYTSKAHTFAMTAWRSDEVREVWDVLMNMDWDSVKIDNKV